MQQRIDSESCPGVYQAMQGLEKYLHQSELEIPLLHLIKLRASKINGCAILHRHALEGSARDSARANSGSTGSMPGRNRRITPNESAPALGLE